MHVSRWLHSVKNIRLNEYTHFGNNTIGRAVLMETLWIVIAMRSLVKIC